MFKLNLLFQSKRTLFLLLTFFCLVVSFIYRNKFYWDFPPISDTFDEFASGWLGLSLLKTGIPTSWSFLPVYRSGIPLGSKLDLVGTSIAVNGVSPDRSNYGSFPKPVSLTKEINLNGFKSHFDIVSPDLEYPPLGGIIVSLPLYFSHVDKFEDATLQVLRKPFVFYSVLSTLFVIWLSYLWYGKFVGIVSGLIYATVPTVVIGSRLALPENVLTLFFLAELILLEYYKNTKNWKLLFLALTLTFIAPLVKPFGLAAMVIGIGYFVIINKNYRLALYFIAAGATSVLFYFLYGISYDRNTFLAAISYQGSRFFSGPTLFLIRIVVPRITKIFLDGWIFFGWISVFILAFVRKSKEHTGLLIASFSYILGLVVFGGEDFGWYRLPLYPFLLIASAYITIKLIKKPDFFTGFIFILTAIATSLQLGFGITDWSNYLIYFRIFIVFMVSVLGLHYLVRRKNIEVLQSGILLGLFLFSLFLNTRIVNNIRSVWQTMGESSSLIMNRK